MTQSQIHTHLQKTKATSYALQALDEAAITTVLNDFAAAIRDNMSPTLTANKEDLARMDPADPLYDRLLLNEERLEAIASDIEKVATLASPVGEIIEQRTLPNGLDLSRIRVPLGVIGAIYEARPNVTFDIFALCFRTQNACVLRGGTDAQTTNEATLKLIHGVLGDHKIDSHIAYLMPPEREHVPALLQAHGLVDVCIPRGSQALIDFVRENASIPVIETGRGVVHTYFDAHGDLAKGEPVIFNAKTRRPSVCNSLDTLLIHKERLDDLKALTDRLAEKGVSLYADESCFAHLQDFYPENLLKSANEETYTMEFMGLSMNIRAVSDLDEALSHIRQYGSGHTESIITENKTKAQTFLNRVDAAVVMVNASTAFCDGGEFGLGAEIGISTQKLHARGPMGLEPLTSYKWVVRGEGQTR